MARWQKTKHENFADSPLGSRHSRQVARAGKAEKRGENGWL